MTDAMQAIRADLFGQFIDAMESKNERKMDRVARSILRVQGGYSGVIRSLKTKARQGGVDLSRFDEESMQLAREAFEDAWGATARPAEGPDL